MHILHLTITFTDRYKVVVSLKSKHRINISTDTV